jgi:hypothetical protein
LIAEAHGDGPLTFADGMTQEFQWSRSLTTILFTVTPKYWKKLPLKLKLQFLFAQVMVSMSRVNDALSVTASRSWLSPPALHG